MDNVMTDQMDRQTAIDIILDHYEHPRHYGPLPGATFSHEGVNPGCGDVVQVYVQVDEEDHIAAMQFEGEGCTISQAAASVLTELAAGRSLDAVLALDEDALAERLGPQIVANRLPCVSLGLRVLQEGIESHLNGSAPV